MSSSSPSACVADAGPSSRAASPAWVLLSVCLAALAMPLSFTGPAVALPALREALGGGPLALNWVTNAFMLSFGATLMACGALADLHGRRRVFLSGLAVVLVSALAQGCLTGQGAILLFDLLRALQGLGAAAALAGGTAALAQVFEGAGRMRAFSCVGTSFGVGLAFGPLLSGWLLGVAGWRGVVLCVAGVALAALVLGLRCMPESRNPQAQRLDRRGAWLFTTALALLTWGVLQGPETGWGSAAALLPLAGAGLALVAFVRVEGRTPQPMLDLSLFRYPRFVGVQLLAAAPAYAFVVLLVLLPVRFIGVEGMAPMQAGRLMFVLSLPMLCVPLLAGWLARWVSAALLCAAGLLVCALGLLWLGGCGPGTDFARMAPPLVLIGLGIGLPWGLMDGLAVSVVPSERAGMATGIFSTVRVAGEGIALALVGAGFAALLASRLSAHAAALPAARQAAQLLVTGDIASAMALLPGVSAPAVLEAYGQAFTSLLDVLAGITVFTALAVFAFLRAGTAGTDMAHA
ncbi:Spectinomycin tetracycline efflux pump [Delftia tsuruhatensis]|uniref:MFS transporter n=1 Tax=Delftia tsuruhatensis TaxID=180282 RepID=UPI001E75BA94|nr:MFS transporter [Delftia tsuruhatensis]CAB5686461.1 Spectinomycin tetracycline efflux pump [Delftia tsuruhatensis]CAC9690425.1 Spectinomycin tetracycline efflux pump [Delftia tsuruhatensis]